MTLEVAVIALVRIIGSLPVLRWAFAGAVLAILVDLSDLFMMNLLDLGGVPNYQVMDKWLDQVYLALFLLVALRWPPVPAAVALPLYLFRLAGFAVYEVTETRWVLLAFPNVFEFWFLAVAAQRLWWPGFRYRLGSTALLLVAVTLAKFGHEWVVHGWQVLDSFTAVEAVEAIWDWLTPG